MTLIQKSKRGKMDTVDGAPGKEDVSKPLRPVRSRRYTRRSFLTGQRPQKRLFTPEIKRFLKDWLVRRRENPYPNRDEKKFLAQETGLTYIQICNWFANWRRKLKNVTEDRNQQTWGHLIRTYNDRAQGNVEQFSICSDDSIWSEREHYRLGEEQPLDIEAESGSPDADQQSDQFQEDSNSSKSADSHEMHNNNIYNKGTISDEGSKNEASPLLLSKWLESAARFQPSEANYSCWAEERHKKSITKVSRSNGTNAWSKHGRDEVEAAVALTALAAATNRLTAP